MNNIPKSRKQFEASNAKLRRARGLYSKNTGIQGVVFSLVRRAYKWDKKDNNYDILWSQWLNVTGIHHIWYDNSENKFMKNKYDKKPSLRIVA